MFSNLFRKTNDKPTQPEHLYLDRVGGLNSFEKMGHNGRLGFTWSGSHPQTPHTISFLHIETIFERIYRDSTHLFFVGAKRGDQIIRLYDRQANMDLIGYYPHDAARLIGDGMIKFLLSRSHPSKTPGLIQQVREGQESPWATVFRDLRIGLIREQLRRYQIPIAAYKQDPDQYNAIKEAPPFHED